MSKDVLANRTVQVCLTASGTHVVLEAFPEESAVGEMLKRPSYAVRLNVKGCIS